MTNDPANRPATPLTADSLPEFIEPAIVCLRRIRRWHAPPNWNSADWIAELRSVAMLAAVEAAGVFDSRRGVASETFIRSRVFARTLTFYRHEWAYATRHRVGDTLPSDQDRASCEYARGVVPTLHCTDGESASEVLAWLPENGRRLLEELYLHERTEADLGRELGISQRAVNKRKHAVLLELRCRLHAEDKPSARPRNDRTRTRRRNQNRSTANEHEWGENSPD